MRHEGVGQRRQFHLARPEHADRLVGGKPHRVLHGVETADGIAERQVGDEGQTLVLGGRVAYPNGIEPEPRPREGLKIISYDAVSGVREFERLGRAVEAAKLEVPIAACYPLSAAARAHQRLAAGHVLGKIVLRVREEA